MYASITENIKHVVLRIFPHVKTKRSCLLDLWMPTHGDTNRNIQIKLSTFRAFNTFERKSITKKVVDALLTLTWCEDEQAELETYLQ